MQTIDATPAEATLKTFTMYARYASLDDFLNNLPPSSWKGFEYSGPVMLCKKGRGALSNAASAGQANTKTAQGLEQTGANIMNSEVNTQGGLSPLVSKQLAAEQGQIGKAYTGAAQAAQRGLAQRGFGVAPSGLQSSITNSAINNLGQAQTGAVGNAFGTQNQLNNSALAQPLAALNTANGAVNSTTEAGKDLSQAGSTLCDIGTGLGTVLGAATGLGKLGGFTGIGKSLMKGSGGGSGLMS